VRSIQTCRGQLKNKNCGGEALELQNGIIREGEKPKLNPFLEQNTMRILK
jgi:hypothetical protein